MWWGLPRADRSRVPLRRADGVAPFGGPVGSRWAMADGPPIAVATSAYQRARRYLRNSPPWRVPRREPPSGPGPRRDPPREPVILDLQRAHPRGGYQQAAQACRPSLAGLSARHRYRGCEQ